MKQYRYLYHYRDAYDYIPRKDPLNLTGQNPEIITDLTKSQIKRLYTKRVKTLKEGDILQIRKTTNGLLGM